MDWYREALRKYAEFEGRSRRKEYWFFALFNTLFSTILVFSDSLVGTFNEAAGLGLLSGIYSLAVMIPSLSVLVRRLHDTGRSGWWALIIFLPLIGIIVLLVFCLLDSDDGDNRYGSNPKGAEI